MKIKSVYLQHIPPVNLFEVNDLSDITIIAGPNGVGKSRLLQHLLNYIQNPRSHGKSKLIIEATSQRELELWNKSLLDTSNDDDAKMFQNILHQNQRRGNWRSGVIYFESDRTIQQVKPFQFTWDLPDPNDEKIEWHTTFKGIRNRYQDTLHSIFKLLEHQKRSIANRAVTLQKQGKTSMNLEFDDPLQPFKNAFSQLLAPKRLLDASAKTQKLQYVFEGKTFDINTLSSGEREVVNIVFDFILRKPEDCIVFFDEPELHLHPELSLKLIQTLKDVGKNNQFILCTHSPDIISSSLDNSVVFIAPPKDKDFNQAIQVSENDETNQALRLLGHSIGIISLGKKIVLIEGTKSSLDKQVYGIIIKNKFPNLVLVPSGGKDELSSISKIIKNVLSKTIWGVDFFMLVDRDTIPLFSDYEQFEAHTGKFRVLKKYHLENYFLDEKIWANIFAEMESEDSWLKSANEIRNQLREIADNLISYTISLNVSSILRTEVGNIDIMPSNCHSKSREEVETLMLEKAQTEIDRVRQLLAKEGIQTNIAKIYEKLSLSIENDTEDWKNLIPGRPILHQFLNRANFDIARAKRLYLAEVERNEYQTFEDIIQVFEDFNEFQEVV